MKDITKPMVLILMGLFLGAFTGSEAEARKGKHGKNAGMMKIFKKLDLSEQQREKLKEIRQGNREEMKELRKQGQELRKKSKEVYSTDSSESELRKIHNQRKEIRNKMFDNRFEKMMKIRNILSPEQRKKFNELKSEHWKNRKGGKGKGRSHNDDEEESGDEDEE